MIDCIYNDRRKWCFNPDVRKPWFRKKPCCIYYGKLCKNQVMTNKFFDNLIQCQDVFLKHIVATLSAMKVLSEAVKNKNWWSPLNETKKGWG